MKWAFRARLRLSSDSARCREQVQWVPIERTPTQAHGIFLRLVLDNIGPHTAHESLVYVTRIERNALVIEKDPSPLAWTDEPKDRWFTPRQIARHQTHRYYIDVCASHAYDGSLNVLSQKWTKGYHRFSESGTYTIDVVAKSLGVSSEGRAQMTIQYDNSRWDSLWCSSISIVSKDWLGLRQSMVVTP